MEENTESPFRAMSIETEVEYNRIFEEFKKSLVDSAESGNRRYDFKRSESLREPVEVRHIFEFHFHFGSGQL